MKTYTYLIVGGGMAADAAVNGIREHDTEGSIGMLCEESDPPYDRPPLSKGLWQDSSIDDIWRGTGEHDLDLLRDRRATALDTAQRTVTDEHGETYGYERLLLATGGKPKRLPFGEKHVLYYRTLEDYRALDKAVQDGKRIAVVGGGFIGSELAAAIAMNDGDAVIMFPEDGIGALLFPPELSQFLTEYYREKGLQVMPGAKAVGIEETNGTLTIALEHGDTVAADYVVAGIGITANDNLAKEAGIDVDDGIVVNEHLMTSVDGIYAAGDVARFHDRTLNERRRVEHEDHALESGRRAGANMAGAAEPYDHLPMFYSDLFDLGYEAVGETRADDHTVCHWVDPNRKGIIAYSRDQIVKGFIFWNVWDMVPRGRELIAGRKSLSDEDIHSWCEEALSKD